MNSSAASSHISASLDLQTEISRRNRAEARAVFLEEFNRLLIESTGDCIVVLDKEGLVESINQSGCLLLNTIPKAHLHTHWTSLFANLETSIPVHGIPNGRCRFEACSRMAGEARYWNITVSCFSMTGDQQRFLMVARDVTEHMLAERALRRSEEAFRKLFEENPIGIVLVDLDHRITKANNALSAMLGYSLDELSRKRLRDLTTSSNGLEEEQWERLLRGETRSFQSEVVFQTKRQQSVWGHVTTSLLRDAENAPLGIFQMIENIQDRKSSEEQLLAYQQHLQSLASELALSEERERRKIATNLHDQIGQSLALVRLRLANLNLKDEPDGLGKLRELIEQAIVDTRSLTFELSPPVLYELGLVAGIEWLAHKFRAEHQIQTRFHDDGQPKPLDEDLRVVLFQAVRELFVNIVKHARAAHAQVFVRRDADVLRIIIEDDGIGFELSDARARREATRSFGLFNIRERLEYLGGGMHIRSELGRGTRVTLIAPLKL